MKSLIIIIGMTLYLNVVYAYQYICAVEVAGGLAYNKSTNSWKGVQFKNESKYIISESKTANNKYIIKQLGSDEKWGWCERGFSKFGQISCNVIGGQFKFNKETGRFLSSYMYGYINGHDNNSDTPLIEAGTCSSF